MLAMAAVSFAATACTHFLSRSRMTRSSVATSARCTQPLATAARAIRPTGNSLLVGCIWPRVEGDSKDILWHPAVNGAHPLPIQFAAIPYLAGLSLLKMSRVAFHSPFTFVHVMTYFPTSSTRCPLE